MNTAQANINTYLNSLNQQQPNSMATAFGVKTQQQQDYHKITSLASSLGSHKPCIVDWLRDAASYNELMSYVQRALNKEQPVMDVVLKAIAKYGLPAANVDTNSCDRYVGGFYTYLVAIRFWMRYPAIDFADNKNCQKIKELSEALEVEKLNADKQKLAGVSSFVHNATLAVISDLQGQYNGAYAGLSCATNLIKEQKNETLEDLKKVTDDSNKATTGNNANNVVKIVAVVLVIVIIIKIFKG